MKKYLKMSDVFEGGVIAKHIDDECLQEISFGESCGNCWSIEDDRYWIAVTKEHAEYAAHAINSHDELVEMNKELIKTLKNALDECEFEIRHGGKVCVDTYAIRKAIEMADGGAE